MPAYNAENYICEAINSILRQSFYQFELIVLNDGSSDGTAECINLFTDPRIVKINLPKNIGLVGARNKLVSIARGKYIALMDSDDVAMPNRLKSQVAFLETGFADICGGEYYSKNEQKGKIKPSKQKYSDADIKALLAICSPLCNPSVMGRAELFKDFPYKPGRDSAEDYALWVDLALSGYRFANLRQKLITYRIHQKQTSQVQNSTTNRVFDQSRAKYLDGLGFASGIYPKSMGWANRMMVAIPFMLKLNQKIGGVSIMANYQIYARFQYRGNGMFTPLTRLERLIVSVFSSIRGCV